MNLLRTLLVYLTMVFVSSVQMAPEPTAVPLTPTPSVTVTASAAATATPTPTSVPTPAITPNNAYHTLQVGDTGDTVSDLQRRLLELGFYTGDIDGKFGNQTRRAVEKFQYNNGLSVDGIAGKRTLTVLYESEDVVSAPAETTAAPTVSATEGPTAAKPTPSASATPVPTFVPTPSPTATPTTAPVQAAATQTPVPQLLVDDTFILQGADVAMTVYGGTSASEPELLHPMQYGEDVYVPFLQILENTGYVVIPGFEEDASAAAFTIGSDLYQLTYRLDADNNVTELALLKNQSPMILSNRNGIVLDAILYLPMQTTAEATGIAYDFNEESGVYTVTLPDAQENTAVDGEVIAS
ncbi:MAG: peptidoglycan-binding domain-containing protein [Eubacteriales bacterium]|nr:peptidoglycan-binding domain-containing protein [Eubacteriales bacterium]